GKELGQARLEVAAPAGILLARRMVDELARRHDLGGHQRKLVSNPRKGDDGLAELDAVDRVGKPEIKRASSHTQGPRGGLDACRLEGLHQLLEALSFDAAQEVCNGHLEVLEANLELLHAAIAQ